MKLTFLYAPVPDLAAALPFYRDTLELDEAWREGEDTVAFHLPDRAAQIMVTATADPAGPMYLVDSVADFLAGHPGLDVFMPPGPSRTVWWPASATPAATSCTSSIRWIPDADS